MIVQVADGVRKAQSEEDKDDVLTDSLAPVSTLPADEGESYAEL